MKFFIFGVCNKVYIINFEKMVLFFNNVFNYFLGVVFKKGKIFFVGIKCVVGEVVKDVVFKCDQYYVNKCWLGGMLINWKIVCQLIKCFKDFEQ